MRFNSNLKAAATLLHRQCIFYPWLNEILWFHPLVYLSVKFSSFLIYIMTQSGCCQCDWLHFHFNFWPKFLSLKYMLNLICTDLIFFIVTITIIISSRPYCCPLHFILLYWAKSWWCEFSGKIFTFVVIFFFLSNEKFSLNEQQSFIHTLEIQT